jgi:titin
MGNSNEGVMIDGAAGNTIGGTNVSERNLISGNNTDGIEIKGASANNNVILGNYIGARANGHDDQRNSGAGVNINGAPDNIVGGTDAGSRNLISGNLQGMVITGAGATGNQVLGNYIGPDEEGDDPLDLLLGVGNLGDGIVLSAGAHNNTIGGTTEQARNLISSNQSDGIEMTGSTTTTNLIQGNYIGTDVSGTFELNNGSEITSNGRCQRHRHDHPR